MWKNNLYLTTHRILDTALVLIFFFNSKIFIGIFFFFPKKLYQIWHT